MKWSFILLFTSALAAGDGPRLFYSKSFPGSTPAYVQVTLEKSGDAEYREAPDDDNPLKFQLTPAETSEVFGLADKLDRFKRPLESGLKVAFMGTKLFRYENGAEKGEVKFFGATADLLQPGNVRPPEGVRSQSGEIAAFCLRCLMESIANTRVPEGFSRCAFLLENKCFRCGSICPGFSP